METGAVLIERLSSEGMEKVICRSSASPSAMQLAVTVALPPLISVAAKLQTASDLRIVVGVMTAKFSTASRSMRPHSSAFSAQTPT